MPGRADNNKSGSSAAGLAIKAIRASENQQIVENPIMVIKQAEDHLYYNRKQTPSSSRNISLDKEEP